jgi:hypothetical protein
MATYGKNTVDENDYKDVLIGTLSKLLELYERIDVSNFVSEGHRQRSINQIIDLIDKLEE